MNALKSFKKKSLMVSMALSMLLPAFAHAGNLTITESQITTSTGNETKPAISGDNIVWEDNRSGNSEIYLYNLVTKTETPITNNGNSNYDPSIDGNKVVWSQQLPDNHSDIYLYDIATETTTRISTSGQASAPKISGNKIVWQDARNVDNDIYLYDLDTNTETQITSDPSMQWNPAISGNKIVWADERSGVNIFLYDIALMTETQVTSDDSYKFDPSISGDKIVWDDSSSGNQDVYMYDLSTNTKTQITTDLADQSEPKISGDKITWTDNRNGNNDIYLYDLATNTEIQITSDGSSHGKPKIDGNRIVWRDDRNDPGGTKNVYLATISSVSSEPVNVGPTSEKFLEDITAGFIGVENNNPSDTSKITFISDYTIKSGDSEIILPAGTEMTKTGGGSFDFTSMDVEDITQALKSISTANIAGAISIGMPNLRLSFSKDISVTIPVPSTYNGQTLNVYYQNSGETTWTNGTTCTVAEGKCVFQTNHATKYSAGEDPLATLAEKQAAKITSWDSYQYQDETQCSNKLKLAIEGRHFDNDIDVRIGNKLAQRVDVKNSKKLTAIFCMEKLLSVKTDLNRKISVKNPNTSVAKAKNKINLAEINTRFKSKDFNVQFKEGIMNIQKALSQLNLLDPRYITGFYGDLTKAAVSSFQQKNNLSPTGNVGSLTKDKLEDSWR